MAAADPATLVSLIPPLIVFGGQGLAFGAAFLIHSALKKKKEVAPTAPTPVLVASSSTGTIDLSPVIGKITDTVTEHFDRLDIKIGNILVEIKNATAAVDEAKEAMHDDTTDLDIAVEELNRTTLRMLSILVEDVKPALKETRDFSKDAATASASVIREVQSISANIVALRDAALAARDASVQARDAIERRGDSRGDSRGDRGR